MASGTGHAKNVANLQAMISAVESFGATYNPPRTDMKIPALAVLYPAARAERDQLLYTPDTGLVDIAEDMKKYVKHVFGTGNPQYAQIKNLKFTEPR
jgi:hypothetical protein